MKRILLFCALGVLWGCRTVNEPTTEAITLSYSTSESSKVGSLTAGDEVAVWARIDGTENYCLEGAKFITGSDGKTLTATPAVYYPETKQAVNFYAYFPYHTGAFSVPTDQSTAAALKQADLCWASASTTPVYTPVSLTFQHLFALLIVQTNKPTSKIACTVVPNGSLDPVTGQFSLNNTKCEVYTTGTELIIPAQPLNRLVLTVANIEYVFEGAINLQSGQTTTINLTLNPATKTATLNGSSTTDWTSSETQGNPTAEASNVLTIHWPKCHPQSSSVNKVILTIKDPSSGLTAQHTTTNGITYANQTFTVPFASANVRYPYTLTNIALFADNEWIHESSALLGATITKAQTCVVGVKQPLNPPAPSDYVKIGSIYWAKGNLVAVSKNNNGECKVGAPNDGGLYFQFGSLIGWKGGALANGGTGVGSNPYTGVSTEYWGGATSYSWTNDAMVWPSELVGTKTTWADKSATNVSTLSDYYYNYSKAPWEATEQNIRDFSIPISGDKGSGKLSWGRYAAKGVGDPCTYYLSKPWRLPTTSEYKTLCNNQGGYNINADWESCNASWTAAPVAGGNFAGTQLFFPASGCRSASLASFYGVTMYGYGWSNMVYSDIHGFSINFGRIPLQPQGRSNRAFGFPVRCVSEAP